VIQVSSIRLNIFVDIGGDACPFRELDATGRRIRRTQVEELSASQHDLASILCLEVLKAKDICSEG